MTEILTTINAYSSLIGFLIAIPACFWTLKKIFLEPFEKLELLISGLGNKIQDTKDELIEKIEDTKEKIQDTKVELKQDIQDAKDEIQETKVELKQDIQDTKDKLSKQIHNLELVVVENKTIISSNKNDISKLDQVVFGVKGNYMKSLSPLGLTEPGKALAAELKAEELIANYADNWLAMLNISENATKLQIQETCLDFCTSKLLDEVSRAESVIIMDAIYQDGNDREPITGIYGILLRNYVFEQRSIEVPALPTKSSETI